MFSIVNWWSNGLTGKTLYISTIIGGPLAKIIETDYFLSLFKIDFFLIKTKMQSGLVDDEMV